MNTVRILAVADAIEQHSILNLGFNMGFFFGTGGELPDLSGHDCNTTACIGGHARALMAGGDLNAAVFGEYDEQEWLDIDQATTNQLFYADNHPMARSDPATWVGTFKSISPAQAVRTLRHLAEIGEVDWTV